MKYVFRILVFRGVLLGILLFGMVVLMPSYPSYADSEVVEYSKEKLIAMNINEINTLPPDQAEQELYSIVHDITAKKQLEGNLNNFQRIVHILIFILILFMISGIIILTKSLKAKNKIQNELENEREHYKSLFGNMREGLAYLNTDYDDTGRPVNFRFLKVNDAYERITGLRRDDIVNKTVLEVYPQFEKYWIDSCKEVVLTGRPIQFENFLKDLGKYFSVNIFEPDKGKLAVVFSDVTKDRVQKAKLIAANSELIAVSTLRDKLFTVITDDIREPLANLVNLSELLAEEMKHDCGEKAEMAETIREYANNTYKMVDNVLEWSRTKKGGEVFKPMKLSLPQLVTEVLQLSRLSAEAKKISVISDMPDETNIYADKDMLNIILSSLLSNAIKYTQRNGKVIITAEQDGEMIVLSVKDTGVGIHSEKVQMLFQDVENNATRGTEGEVGIGVGLFICRRFIQINGGDIWVESTAGVGSNFFISIPKYIEE